MNDFAEQPLVNANSAPRRQRARSAHVEILEILMVDSHVDALALLKADHRKVEELFEQFEAAEGAARSRTFIRAEVDKSVPVGKAH